MDPFFRVLSKEVSAAQRTSSESGIRSHVSHLSVSMRLECQKTTHASEKLGNMYLICGQAYGTAFENVLTAFLSYERDVSL